MSGDPTLDFLESGGGPPPSGDPTQDFLASGGELPSDTKRTSRHADASMMSTAAEFLMHEGSGLGASAIAGIKSAYGLVRGKPLSEIDKESQKFISEHTYEPRGAVAAGAAEAYDRATAATVGKVFDTLGTAINAATDVRTWQKPTVSMPISGRFGGEQALAQSAAASSPQPLPTTGTGSTALGPIVSGIAQVAAGAKPIVSDVLPMVRQVGSPVPTARTAPGWGSEAPEKAAAPAAVVPVPAMASGPAGASQAPLSVSGAPRSAYFEPQDIPGKPGLRIDTEPVEGGLPAGASDQRAAVLQRVGIDQARESALRGDAKSAATDWQLSKFDEPAGVAAKAQFDAERSALQQHAQGLVERTGGTIGTDEDTLHLRGQSIARPFDDLADWFDQKRKQLYSAADQRSGGHPVVQPLSLRGLLDDPSFNNQLTARNQMHIRNGVAAELARFQETNPAGLTVQNAEQFRQFLNTLWTPENSPIIGRLKGALDDDVMKGAGEDLYGPARALSQLQHQVLDNPSGVAKLLERDPQTPINRTTPFVKIPDTISRLDPAQFDNVLKTLDTMPEEIQPAAQAAKAEIKAHLANKVLDAGNSTVGQWNARGVEKVVKANSAKLQSAFEDQPEILRGIQDLRSAGNILSVNQSYPGAAAQAANALKRGFMSRALGKVGATAGAGAGSVLGPLGAAGGAAAGEALGATVGQSVAEKSALKQWQKGVKRLSDVVPP